jgi:hypothetical protein
MNDIHGVGFIIYIGCMNAFDDIYLSTTSDDHVVMDVASMHHCIGSNRNVVTDAGWMVALNLGRMDLQVK